MSQPQNSAHKPVLKQLSLPTKFTFHLDPPTPQPIGDNTVDEISLSKFILINIRQIFM